jgi:hypothetical protein
MDRVGRADGLGRESHGEKPAKTGDNSGACFHFGETGCAPCSFRPMPSVFILRKKLLRSRPTDSAVRVTLRVVS